MTITQPTSDAPRNWPPRPGVRERLVRGTGQTERLADVRARLANPDDPAPDADWQVEARIAADWGLLVLAGNGDDQTVTRTEFGDTWAATFDSAEPSGRSERRWPLSGPGKFDLWFFPLVKRPAFVVFALTGPTVLAIGQGGWNLERGFGQPAPNPVTDVEMRTTLDDGTEVSVQSASHRIGLPALQLSNPTAYRSIADSLLTAMNDRSALWRVRPLDVDGNRRELLVLDMDSAALPKEIVGPGLLAVADLDGTQITIIGNDPVTEFALTKIDPDDLLHGRT